MGIALILACQNRKKNRIESLLLKGEEDLNFRDILGNTALHYLCMNGEYELAELLIIAGGIVEVENNQRITPLHAAAASGSIPLVRLLLEKGADINAQDIEDKTPLIYAISNGQQGIAEFLISSGADKHTRTINGLSPIDFAKAAEMDTLIPFFDSRFPWIDKKGNSALHNAVYQNGVSMVRNILSTDKSGIDARNNEGLTPLLISASRLNFGVSDVLLQFGANSNLARPEDGYTPLHIAAKNGITWLGEILLEHKANINVQTLEGYTPLMLAIQGQHREFASMLLRHGAAIGITDHEGRSARDHALEWGSENMVEILDAQKPQKPQKLKK